MSTLKETKSDGVKDFTNMIPLLQDIQNDKGYLSIDSMEEIAQIVGVPVSRVYGVATFYRQFRFAPLGVHIIQICRGTACHVRGSLNLAHHLERRLRLSKDGNSPDGMYSVIAVACLGCCAIAPVIKLGEEFYGHLTAQKLDKLLDKLEVKS